ncbi:hypothetical protein SAMN04488085_104154 [Geodermatophilus ruber]|uniref:Uncharacterized protein n=1 Tax=Geodermatophilus ruber TaxID=504800 RepID=A0A1I4D760_9ACTN|nr:hypothetical protein SAMN04488085_104154 [Geodermatophilus ruber]
MSAEPRLRLIGGGSSASPRSAQVLAILDGTRVVIRTGPDMTGPHTTALAVRREDRPTVRGRSVVPQLRGGRISERPIRRLALELWAEEP